MNSRKNQKSSSLVRCALALLALSQLLACGVKGDPLPPERPAHLGRGRPTYRRATESLKIESGQGVVEPGTRKLIKDDESTDDDDEDRDQE